MKKKNNFKTLPTPDYNLYLFSGGEFIPVKDLDKATKKIIMSNTVGVPTKGIVKIGKEYYTYVISRTKR